MSLIEDITCQAHSKYHSLIRNVFGPSNIVC